MPVDWYRSRPVAERSAMVLVIVLVAVAMLSLAAYTFSELMLTEHQSARVVGRQAQARELTHSGAALIQYFLSQTPDAILNSGGTYDNGLQFQGLIVADDGTPRGRGRISIVAPKIESGQITGVRYGLENESARINVNALVQWDKQKSGVGRQILMTLPGMDETIADAILDWIDTDDTPRENGAESETYSNLSPPYMPTNGPISTIEELLKVRGVTPQLLFGADTNRNGMIDPGEDANAQLATSAGADPEMNRGWAAYLTVCAKESNLQPDGVTPKININGSDLQQLHDDLAAVLDDDELVNFILAARIYGLTQPTSSNGQSGQSQSGQGQSGQNQGGQGGQNQSGKGGGQNNTGGKSSRLDPNRFEHPRSPLVFVQAGGRAGGGAGGAGGPGGGGPGAGGPGGGGPGGAGGPGAGAGGRAGGAPGAAGGRAGGGAAGKGGPGGPGARAGGPGGKGGPGGGKGGFGKGGQAGGKGGFGKGGGGFAKGGGANKGGGGAKSGNGNEEEVSAADLRLDLTQKPSSNITSLLDLIGATIRITNQGTQNSAAGGAQPNGGGKSGGGGTQNSNSVKVVIPAFPDDPTKARDYLTTLLDYVTTSKATSFPGRININQASRTVMLGIPGLDSDKVDAIIGSREPEYSGQKPEQKYETWLYTEGVLTLDQMKAVWPYITTGGSVYRAQIVGYFDEGGPSCRVEAIFDTSPPSSNSSQTASTGSGASDTSSSGTTQTSTSQTTSNQSTTGTQATTSLPRIVFWRDLSNLGRGFPLETLSGSASQSP